jgi:hypothetical protein
MPASLSKRENKSRTKLSKCDNNLSGWDRAIEDARKGIKRLESAIETFTEGGMQESHGGGQAVTRLRKSFQQHTIRTLPAAKPRFTEGFQTVSFTRNPL